MIISSCQKNPVRPMGRSGNLRRRGIYGRFVFCQ